MKESHFHEAAVVVAAAAVVDYEEFDDTVENNIALLVIEAIEDDFAAGIEKAAAVSYSFS